MHPMAKDERGMAMIVALLVTMVVLMLSITVVAQSLHNLESSGSDRRRLLSVSAAEAGTNDWYAYLQTTPPSSMSCNDRTATVASAPSTATYSADVTFYAADGATEMNCPFSDETFPSFAKVVSTGDANGQERDIETFVRLTPNYGGFGAAILAVNGTTFGNNFDIYGDTGNDGDIYVLTGNLVITNTPNIRGNVYVPQGGVSMSNGNTIWGNLWARDSITIDNPASVKGSVLSETGSISGSGTIEKDASAAGSISGSLAIGGVISANTAVPTTPTQTFPTIGFDSATWGSAGYTINTYSGAGACTSARTFVQGSWSGNYVLRITGPNACTFSVSNNATVGVNGHLAIISDWGFDLNNQNTWNGSAGAIKKVHFISVAPAASCPASGITNKNIVVGNNSNFDSQTNAFFYTPCSASMRNSNAFSGQVMAANVSILNNFKMNYKPVLVPGVTGVTGFKQDISYVREV